MDEASEVVYFRLLIGLSAAVVSVQDSLELEILGLQMDNIRQSGVNRGPFATMRVSGNHLERGQLMGSRLFGATIANDEAMSYNRAVRAIR